MHLSLTSQNVAIAFGLLQSPGEKKQYTVQNLKEKNGTFTGITDSALYNIKVFTKEGNAGVGTDTVLVIFLSLVHFVGGKGECWSAKHLLHKSRQTDRQTDKSNMTELSLSAEEKKTCYK